MVAASCACLWIALVLYAGTRVGGEHSRVLGRAASAAAGLGWLGLTAVLVTRGLAAGHWPLTDRYEFALCWAWAIAGIYLLLELRWRERAAGAFVMAAALLVVTFALLRPEDEKAIHPLLPALRSIWLQAHVVSAAVGYGACGVAAGLAAAQLIGAGLVEGRKLEPSTVERQIERVIGWGFPWLSMALVTGAIWAQDAWGRYWGWDPKESWTLIIWLWYLILLHIRGLRGWQGRRMAWLTLAGFGITFFALAGLPWLLRTVRMSSLHAF
jgi:ABC-type transport system involved in cytochrome c biogenesis permease subunit